MSEKMSPAAKADQPQPDEAKPVTKAPDAPKQESKSKEKLTEEMVQAIESDPGMFAQFMRRLKASPVLHSMAKANADGAILAAKSKAGSLLLGRARNNLIRPLLPVAYQPIMDNAFVASAVDVGIANISAFGLEMIGHKLPEKIIPYTDLFTESLMYAAYNGAMTKMDIEGFFIRLFSGDVMALFTEVIDLQSNGSVK